MKETKHFLIQIFVHFYKWLREKQKNHVIDINKKFSDCFWERQDSYQCILMNDYLCDFYSSKNGGHGWKCYASPVTSALLTCCHAFVLQESMFQQFQLRWKRTFVEILSTPRHSLCQYLPLSTFVVIVVVIALVPLMWGRLLELC